MNKDTVKISVSWQSSGLKLRHTIWIGTNGLHISEQSGTENCDCGIVEIATLAITFDSVELESKFFLL